MYGQANGVFEVFLQGFIRQNDSVLDAFPFLGELHKSELKRGESASENDKYSGPLIIRLYHELGGLNGHAGEGKGREEEESKNIEIEVLCHFG